MDHFWIILGPFWSILLIALSSLCQWSCGFVDHFLEVKLLEQVNFHFEFFFFTHIVGAICCCVILTFGSYIFGSFFATQIGRSICCFVCALGDTYIWKLHFWIIFCNTNWWINMVFCACSRCHLCRVFGSFFLLMNWWIISFTPCPLVVRKIADHFARQGGGGGGLWGG